MDVDMNNKLLKEYIDYYKSINEPGYAVLVTGEWGVGKTYQITKTLNKDEMCYVSLFGLTTTSEIYASVYLKMFPYKAKVKKLAGLFGNSNLKIESTTLAFGGLLSNIANAILEDKADKSKIIVFDDLERCNIALDDILGSINKYVEHHKCRVIVIAHSESIKEEISRKKEKIFGQIVKVTPDIENAFAYFKSICKIPDSINSIEKIIHSSYISSQCKSLRVLQHTINDCSRLLACLNKEHIEKEALVNELFTLFSAVSIEHRAGNLEENDLINRDKIYYMSVLKTKDNSSPKLITMQEKYCENGIVINIQSNLISDSDLIKSVINGFFDSESIRQTLNNSKFFEVSREIRPWFKIINFDQFETQDVDQSISDLDDKINKLEITEPGEILHSFILLLMLSHINEISITLDDVLLKAKKYLHQLRLNNTFPAPEIGYRFGDLKISGAFGYAYWIKNEYKNESDSLFSLVEKEMSIAFKKRYPGFISEIKGALNEDIDYFCDMITPGNSGKGQYAYVDVLAYIKPYEFVDIWLSLKKQDWQKVRSALNNRYSTGTLRNLLSKESKWISNVKTNLSHRASKVTGIDRLRITRLIPD